MAEGCFGIGPVVPGAAALERVAESNCIFLARLPTCKREREGLQGEQTLQLSLLCLSSLSEILVEALSTLDRLISTSTHAEPEALDLTRQIDDR